MIRNGTPHPINIYDADGVREVARLGPSETAFNTKDHYAMIGRIGQTPIMTITHRELEYGMVNRTRTGGRISMRLPAPPPMPDVFWVVSLHTAAAAPDREDFLVPGEPVYGPGGRQIGCRGLRDPREARTTHMAQQAMTEHYTN